MNINEITFESVVQHIDSRDTLRSRGIVVDVKPFGEFEVKWDKIKRPERMLRYQLRKIE